ncbi:heme exporter protein CcmB [Thiohalocapsa sp.]|uniref:heme exporter protein CcmB n=1 Tax=Thiohalocapsa sp. TaxID=2497641 RepID=UPI0025E15A25|nr:heme exporter protein CcmB [Thiohalocapsa sp.]
MLRLGAVWVGGGVVVALVVGGGRVRVRMWGRGVGWARGVLWSRRAVGGVLAADYDDGTLGQLLLAGQPLSLLVLAKIVAHWLLTGLPLVVIAPIMAMKYSLEATAIWVMMVALALGTPVLSLLGAIGAALTLGLRGGGILLSLLILPLYIPVLVYGAGAVSVSVIEIKDTEPYFALLGAFLLGGLVLAPPAAAAALRISME